MPQGQGMPANPAGTLDIEAVTEARIAPAFAHLQKLAPPHI